MRIGDRGPLGRQSRDRLVAATDRLLLAALLALAAPTRAQAEGFDLADLRWQSRPLLVFAPGPDDAAVAGPRAELARAAPALRERDMVLIEVLGSELASIDGASLPRGTAAELRSRFQVPNGARVLILIGKDGGEKLRAGEPWDLADVLATVDRMPMRRQEMRARGGD